MMVKVIQFLNNVLDRLLTVFLVLVLLIGIWFLYDTLYVFYGASPGRVAPYRPDAEEDSSEVRPFTEDYAAWLSMKGTDIEYPVMQAENNLKYLNTDPYGDYSLSGAIFLDCRNNRDFSDSYSLLYGHHMSGNLMFGALDNFYDETYFDSHRTGTLAVGDQVYHLESFALLSEDAREEVFFEPQGSLAVLEAAESSAIYYRTPKNEHILALSTCVDAASTMRTILLLSMEPEIDS